MTNVSNTVRAVIPAIQSITGDVVKGVSNVLESRAIEAGTVNRNGL